ncbi:MAG: exodeoxyribonuclease VII large subunit [Amylibacter sp.]|nr:exodeoxyribonuclease VII large subunit [Amylibacter sp.]
MSDLIDQPEPGQNAPEFSVSEISGAVKRMIEGEFSHVRIRGEIGRVNRYASGHIYYDLKDENAVLNAVTWKGQASKLSVQPEEGMEVIAVGKLTSFPKQSKYQMNVMELRVAGVGALMAMLEKRKKALAAEGLFDQDRKRAIPYLPDVIGVVTSPSGAVIRDILHRLRDRFPRKVLIWPVAVQGDRCAPEVTRAIEGFNAMTAGGAMPRPDLIIVARGGGSIEDLWGFNEESVVRAAAASDIPLISAVGHETDTTLIDYASDMRAPTPTAAAELAVPVRSELAAWLAGMEERRVRALANGISLRGQRLRDLARAMPNPVDVVAMQGQKLDMVAARLPRALQGVTQAKRVQLAERTAALRPQALRQMLVQKDHILQRVASGFSSASTRQVERWRSQLDGLERLRETLGYKATIKRGYAVVRGADGVVLSTAKAAKAAGALDIEFKDGHFSMDGVQAVKKPKAKPKKPTGDQGSLF